MSNMFTNMLVNTLLSAARGPAGMRALFAELDRAGGNQTEGTLAASIALAFAEAGVRETSQNRGPEVDAINALALAAGSNGKLADAEPWCARFVIACWYMAGLATGKALDNRVSRSGSVFYLMHETQRRASGLVQLASQIAAPTWEIKPGDALIRYRVKPEFLDVPVWERKRAMTTNTHTEIVASVDSDGSLVTVGGNTNAEGARDGDGVHIHYTRYRVDSPDVVGFVRPIWLPRANAV